jgi:ribonuclease MRP protein subunit SNM1
MVSQELSIRLKYLNDSAHFLATTTTSTSAYLQSQCHSLISDNDIDQMESSRRYTCGACGNLNIVGWTSTIQLNIPRKKQNARRRAKVERPLNQAKDILYKCELCGRVTQQHIPKMPGKTTRACISGSRTQDVQNPANPSTPLPAISQATLGAASANVSSRKRAKIRKHGGLQALLAKSKEEASRGSSGSFGLDLLDLMKIP